LTYPLIRFNLSEYMMVLRIVKKRYFEAIRSQVQYHGSVFPNLYIQGREAEADLVC